VPSHFYPERQCLVFTVIVALATGALPVHAQTAGQRSTIVGAWVHVPTDGDAPPTDSIVFRANGTYSQWLFITSRKPQRVDGRWTRNGKHYKIDHAGAGDSFILSKGYLILGDAEGVIRGYRRTRP
jgi:hypothetical protein